MLKSISQSIKKSNKQTNPKVRSGLPGILRGLVVSISVDKLILIWKAVHIVRLGYTILNSETGLSWRVHRHPSYLLLLLLLLLHRKMLTVELSGTLSDIRRVRSNRSIHSIRWLLYVRI